MATALTMDPMPPALSSPWLEHAPTPMATVEGATHRVRDVNAAFCRLLGGTRADLVGKSFCDLFPRQHECLALLDGVYHTGKPASFKGQDHAGPGPAFSSYLTWPVMADDHAVGVVIQVTETAPLYERTLEMNQALLLGSLRQHELTEAAEIANTRLQAEIRQRMQSELDALMLTKEISHRIKNNLQIVIALIANEIRRTPAGLTRGYIALGARIAAIAKLYELISQSSSVETVSVDAYLREIAKTMSASLLEPASGISIQVRSDAIDIEPDRAVPLGLLVNELGTNAIKHAFPGGSGQVMLGAERMGDQIVLTVSDNGVGMASRHQFKAPGRHGSDYVAIFVRQLGGPIAVSGSEGTGTTVTIHIPVLEFTAPAGEPLSAVWSPGA
jgi:two-component sensor histidine kinase